MKQKKLIALVLSMGLVLGLFGVTAWSTYRGEEDIDIEPSVTEETVEETVVEPTEEAVETEVVIEDPVEDGEEPVETEYVNLYDYESVTTYDYYDFQDVEYALTDIYVRAAGDPNADIVASVKQGDSLIVIASSSDSPWIIVEVNGVRGYANGMHVLPVYNTDFPIYSDYEVEEFWAN